MGRNGIRFVAAAIVAVALAACGGVGGGGTAKGSNPTTTVASSLGTGPPPQPVDTKFTGAGSADYCRLARTYSDASSKLSPTNTSSDLRQLFQDAARDIKAAVGVAPAEIKDDVQIVADGFNALVNSLTPVNYDFTKLAPDLIARFQSQEFMAASTRVAAYSRQVCGVGAS